MSILLYIEIWDIKAAVIEEMLNKKKNKNLDYTVLSFQSGVRLCRQKVLVRKE